MFSHPTDSRAYYGLTATSQPDGSINWPGRPQSAQILFYSIKFKLVKTFLQKLNCSKQCM